MLRRLALPVIVMLLAPGGAGAWSYEVERGLDLYRTPPAPSVVSLVCDPQGVYGGDESAVLVEFDGLVDYSGDLVFRFPDGVSVDATMVHGRIGKPDVDPKVWASILTGLRSHEAFSVEQGNDAHEIQAGEIVGFTCV